ncbi:MAG: response regulator [Janthinobacterium lividum]
MSVYTRPPQSKLSSVLLVDDDTTTNYLNKHLLRSLGVTDWVLVAQDVAMALAQLADACLSPTPDCPALILLDLNMPVMNGIDFLEASQSRPPSPQMVIVVLTTSSHPAELARVRKLTTFDAISKPLTREKVQALLLHHFQWQLPAISQPGA